jgi:acetolactate synthase-1/2/3 large subunit
MPESEESGARVERRSGPWIVRLLASYGIEIAFGIPGVHTVALYEGLSTGALTHVTPRHEQGAGFMADGYARIAGKPAACFVITGPGLTNVATAMAQAYAESVPMLVLSSTSHRRHLGRGLGQLHELPDQQALASQVSAFSHTLHDLADLPQVLDRAFAVFESGRPRPVHIEIPLDVWDQTPPATPIAAARTQVPRPTPGAAAIRAAAGALQAAERPVILAGGGAVRAAGPLRGLAERLDAPVVMTANARGLLAPSHPLAVPASPSLAPARALIAESDAVLAVGTELGPTDYDMYETGMPDWPRPLVRIDLDAAQLTRPVAADVPVLADAAPALGALAEALGAPTARAEPTAQAGGAARAEQARSAAVRGLEPAMQRALAVANTVRDALPEALLIGDSTQPIYAGNLAFGAAFPGQWHNSATGYGTLGWALPASLGAALAAPTRPVVCLIGDGGLHYTLGELAAIRQAGRPVIVLLWNNAGYGEIKAAMQAEGVAPVGVELFTPDFDRLAEAYGFAVAVPERVDQLPELLRAAAARDLPTLIRLEEAVALA